jgi:lipopolysaccharide/colanic/teichoic acid biosynthesis glycosyltransferase
VKRIFDIIAAFMGLVLLFIPGVLVAAAVKVTSAGPVFFRQERVGRRFRLFRIYKFRTMVQDAPLQGGQITFGDDPRITRIGRILRKTKIDELPQLINVLVGDMSLVGPRPEVPRYVELFHDDYVEILTARPGITDLASLKYRDEASILGSATDPDKEYTIHILPEKIAVAKEYVRRASLWLDFSIIFKTILVGLGFEPLLPGENTRGASEPNPDGKAAE